MSPELLREAGEALFGRQWQTALAEALGVADRTVRRWAAGQPVPPGAQAELLALMEARGATLRALASRLRKAA